MTNDEAIGTDSSIRDRARSLGHDGRLYGYVSAQTAHFVPTWFPVSRFMPPRYQVVIGWQESPRRSTLMFFDGIEWHEADSEFKSREMGWTPSHWSEFWGPHS